MKSFIKVFPSVVLLVLTMFFSGCAVSKTPNYPNLEKIEMKEDEQIVYFIREDTILGAAINTFVECNNKRFLLKYGEYTYCKIKKGINTISHGQHTPGLFFTPILEIQHSYASSYMAHDFSNDKELYMFVGVKGDKGIYISKITKDEASEYLKNGNYDFRLPVDNGINGNNHLVALLNPATLLAYDSKINNLKIQGEALDNDQLKLEIEKEFQILKNKAIEKKEQMKMIEIPLEDDNILKKRAEENVVASKGKIYEINFFLERNGISFIRADENRIHELDKNKSRIVLYRESDNGNWFAEIWTKDQYIGGLLRNTYLEIETDQNDLTLFTNYGKWELINLKLEKGKTYYVRADFSLGWEINSIQLLNSNENEFEKQKLYQLYIDDNKMLNNYKIRINEALKLINSKDFTKDENINLAK